MPGVGPERGYAGNAPAEKMIPMKQLVFTGMTPRVLSAAAAPETAAAPSAVFSSGTKEQLQICSKGIRETASMEDVISLPLRLAVPAADALAVWLTARLLVRRRQMQTKNTAEAPAWIVWFFLIAGLLISVPPLVIREKSDWFPAAVFEAAALFCFALSAFAAQERFAWDENRIEYTSVTGKKSRYGLEEIRWIETAHPYGRRYDISAFRIHLAGRTLRIEDLSGNMQSFLSAYGAWLREKHLEPWLETAQREWLAAYRSHSPFRKKLDRIDASLTPVLVMFTFLGSAAAGASLYLLCAQFLFGHKIGTPAEVIAISVICLCLGLFLLGIWPAIAMMDSRPELLRMYLQRNVRILPDPEKQENQEQ